MLNAYLAMAGRPDVEEWPDFVVHIETHTGRTLSFRELRKRINGLATALGAPTSLGGFGLQPGSGEIIGIMSDNSSVRWSAPQSSVFADPVFLQDYVTLAIACLKIAVPFLLISCYSTPFELKHALSLGQATRLFVAPQYISRVVPVAAELGLSRDKIYLMNQDIQGQTSIDSLIKHVNSKKIPEERVRIVPKDTLGYLVFSSGTSGLPKGTSRSRPPAATCCC